jgi:hypothetical protein
VAHVSAASFSPVSYFISFLKRSAVLRWCPTVFLIPETKGLSLEQIDILYQNTNAIKSVSYRRQLIAEDVHPAAPDAIAPMPKEKVDQVHHKEHV